MIRLSVRNNEANQRALLTAASRLDDTRIALRVAEVIRGRARIVVPRKTGRLMRSIDLFRAPASIRVTATAPYAAAVSYGGPSNPRPVPFMEIAAIDSYAQQGVAAESEVELQLERAGVL